MILVTHEPRHLQLLSGRVVVLRERRVLRVVESWREVCEFLERNLYEVTIVTEGGDLGPWRRWWASSARDGGGRVEVRAQGEVQGRRDQRPR